MNTIIICKSIHLGSTRKIADTLAERLGADVVEPEDFDISSISRYDLIGFGSGIYAAKHHPSLLSLVDSVQSFEGKNVFVFSTAALTDKKDHYALNSMLKERNAVIVGEYFSRGWNKNSFMKSFGGMNKGRPNSEDIQRAVDFAERLKECRDSKNNDK